MTAAEIEQSQRWLIWREPVSPRSALRPFDDPEKEALKAATRSLDGCERSSSSRTPSHRPDPNLGERKCGAAWGVTERQAQVSERQTAFSLSLPGDYGGDEMFSSVSNSSRRKFWAADERCGSIVEVPKRRKTKPTVSLSLPSRIFPAAILSFAREGKKYPDFDFSWVFFHHWPIWKPNH